MEISKIRKIVENIEGWLTNKEGEKLYNLAKKCRRKGVIVEIGSWKGKSTVWLSYGSKAGDNVKVYAIDPHTGSYEHKLSQNNVWTYDEFEKNIKNAKIDDMVTPIVKTSEEAAKSFNEPIGFIFIDGAHEYKYVKLDFDLWFDKVLNGGIMAFHDTMGWPGPKKVVSDLLFKSRYFKNVRFKGTITYGEKVEKNSVKDRMKNRLSLLCKKMFELVIFFNISPKIIKKINRFLTSK